MAKGRYCLETFASQSSLAVNECRQVRSQMAEAVAAMPLTSPADIATRTAMLTSIAAAPAQITSASMARYLLFVI